jgi:CTP:molybdopterin cytidylyltransferase MocA
MAVAKTPPRGWPVVILAAGHGTRMGGPKAFARFRERTFLEHILDRCAESDSPVTVTVDPSFKARLLTQLKSNPVPHARLELRWVEVDGRLPMVASLQAALMAGGFRNGFWLWPVDAPFLSAAGWRTLGGAVALHAEQILKPRSGGRTGHPVWFPGWAIGQIASGNWPIGLRGFLQACDPARIRMLELPGEFLNDVDTPEELAAMEAKDTKAAARP